MKQLKKTLAVFLVILTIFTTCSAVMPVFAESGLVVDDLNPAEESNVEPYVISEVIEKREEYAKHFLMSDGSFMVAQYDSPVHEQDNNGDWVNINNTISETEATAEQKELFGTDELYSTGNTTENVVFAEKSNSNTLVSYEANEYPISLNYQSAKKSYIKVIKDDTELTGDDAFLTLPYITQEVVYEDVFPCVDLQYIVSSAQLKENIILKSKSAQNSFTVNYNIGELTAEVVDSNAINLMAGSEVVYTITAPYMADANGERSEAVTLAVEKNKNGKLRIRITAESTWLQDENRAYPVVVDPTVVRSNYNELTATYVSGENASAAYKKLSDVCVSRDSSGNEKYTLIKLENLSDSIYSDRIVTAKLYLPLNGNVSENTDVFIYKITSAWDVDTVTYGTKPDIGDSVIDYCKLTTESTHLNPEITELYYDIHNNSDNCHGVLLKLHDTGSVNFKVQSSDTPVLLMSYLSTVGLDEDYSYSQFDMGSAGTVYLNNLTGNLILTRDEMSTTGKTDAYNLTSTYNSYSPVEGMEPSWFRSYEYGFRSEIQLVNEYGTGEMLTVSDTADEDGYYTLSDNSAGFTKARYNKDSSTGEIISIDALTDDETVRYSFDPEKGLIGMYSKDAESETVVFSRDGTNLVDGSGHKLEITDTAATYTAKQLDTDKNLTGDTITHTKDANGNVTQITLNGAVEASFTYDSLNRMTSVTNNVGYTLTFGYSETGKAVTSVSESKNGISGQQVHFDREFNSVDTTTSGADGVFGNGDDVVTTYKFNKKAQVTQVQNKTQAGEDLGAVAYAYKESASENLAGLESLSSVSAVGKNVVNLLKNHNLESSDNWTATTVADTAAVYTASHTTEKAFSSLGSLKITVDDFTKNGVAAYSQSFTSDSGVLIPGETYTASAYINTASLTKDSNADSSVGYGAGVIVAVTAGGKTEYIYSDSITQTVQDINGGWERTFATFTVPQSYTKIDIMLAVRNAVGTAYFDAVQLENSDIANQYNILENNGFTRTNTSSFPENWSGYNTASTDLVQNGQMKIVGDTNTKKAVYQDIQLTDAKQSDSYTYSAWARANAVPFTSNRYFVIYPYVRYADENGNLTWKHKNFFHFDYHDNDEQYITGSFNLKHPDGDTTLTPVTVRLLVCYYNQCNTAYFDNVALYRSDMVYELDESLLDEDISQPVETTDGAGNVLSRTYPDGTVYEYTYTALGENEYVVATETVTETVTDENGNTTTEVTVYEYNTSQQLIKLTEPDGTVYNYTYDGDKLISKLTADGVGDRYTYTDDGKVLTETYEDGSSYAYTYYVSGELYTETATEDGVETIYTYNENGKLVSESETKDGVETIYTYNENGKLVSESETKDGVTTVHSYTYDSYGNVLTVAKDDVVIETYSYYDRDRVKTHEANGITCNYDIDGNLTKVDHNGFSYVYEYDAFGNTTNVKLLAEDPDNAEEYLLNQSLISYTYQQDKSKLSRVTYGNGSQVNYAYDAYGNIAYQSSILGTVGNRFDALGNIVYQKDNVTGRATSYKYDETGNFYGEKVASISTGNSGNNFLYSSCNKTDENGNVTKNILKTNNATLNTSYSYTESGSPLQTVLGSTRKVNFTYDEDEALTGRTLTTNTSVDESFTYNDEGYISTHTFTHGETSTEYNYTYDDKGNITEIKKGGVVQQSYVYDENNQLIKENNVDIGKIVEYTYDGHGNIKSKTEYDSNENTVIDTINYTYDTAWKDKLTSYNGQSITYDAIGNPTNYMGATMTWFARQMQSYSKNGTNITYTYDADGLRTQKVVGGIKHEYYYVDGQLRYEKNGDSYEMYYRYDSDGRPVLATKRDLVTNQNYQYYLITNTRGDVIETRNGSGEVNAKFTYDAWGKIISVTDGSGNELPSDSFAYQISLKYRGYVYDSETGLYYLQSRYYDPETGRFLNADAVDYIGASGTVLGYNAFAYCENEPVCRVDADGKEYEYIFAELFICVFMLELIEIFLKEYLGINNIIKIKSINKNSKTELYKCKVKYTIIKNHNLTIQVGDKNAWKKCCDYNNHLNEKILDLASVVGDFAYGAVGDPVYDQRVVWVYMVVALITTIGTYVLAENKANESENVYNKVWGTDGLDPQNKYAYYVFYVSNSENDDSGSKFDGYHAYSSEKGKGVAIKV